MRFKGSKRIIGHLGTRRRDSRNQCRFSNIRKSYETHVRNQLQFQGKRSNLARRSVLVVSRRAIRRSRELRVAFSAASALRDDKAFTGLGKIMNQLAAFAVGNQRADGHKHKPVFAVFPVTFITFAVRTAACSIFWIEAELQKGV